MKIEDIEKKSLEYAKTATPSCVFGDFDKYAIADALEHGANWRINSVWHYIDKKEIPECFKSILLEYKEQGIPLIKVAIRDHYDDSFFMEGWIRWAYVEDLFPNKQEE